MIHITVQYGSSVTTLPSISSETLSRATAQDLRLLIRICALADPLSFDHMEALCAALASDGSSTLEVAASIAFWRGAGVLSFSETSETASSATVVPSSVSSPKMSPQKKDVKTKDSTSVSEKPAVTVRRMDQLPHYSQKDITGLLESRTESRENIEECNRICEKILNMQEISDLLVLSDYLKLDWDYILSLLARCVEETKKRGSRFSMRTVVNRAIQYFDAGIQTLDALQENFRKLDCLAGAEHRLRDLFGMGDRKLTPNETRFFSTWLYDYHYDVDIIQMAYNITVDTKGTPKMSYINSVLANWNSAGLKTPAEIEAAQVTFRNEREQEKESRRAKRSGNAGAPTVAGTFDTDDFFNAAVRRSLGDDA